MSLRLRPALVRAAVGVSLLLTAQTALAEKARLILDARTGTVLEAENADQQYYPASLTKMMTLYLTFEALHKGTLKWDDKLVLSANAESKDPFKYALGAGKTITVKEAVLGMIVLSANDAAVAVAEHFSSSEAAFGKVMTDKAHALGMTNTVFTNPAGLPDPVQVSTARDMATLGLALMRDFPEDFKLFATRKFVFRGMKLHGHNRMMASYPGVDGIKTGYTEAAGYNLVTSASKGDKRVVGVVIGAKSSGERDQKMTDMLNKYLGGETKAATR
jgi:D-alanyl-D-alanine carboxypeptidase (penicillin-binding protein 5/6)